MLQKTERPNHKENLQALTTLVDTLNRKWVKLNDYVEKNQDSFHKKSDDEINYIDNTEVFLEALTELQKRMLWHFVGHERSLLEDKAMISMEYADFYLNKYEDVLENMTNEQRWIFLDIVAKDRSLSIGNSYLDLLEKFLKTRSKNSWIEDSDILEAIEFSDLVDKYSKFQSNPKFSLNEKLEKLKSLQDLVEKSIPDVSKTC
jgi:hypothetical protein